MLAVASGRLGSRDGAAEDEQRVRPGAERREGPIAAHSSEKTAAGAGAPVVPLLRVPPFPGARSSALAVTATAPEASNDEMADRIIAAIRSLKVGGTYWGAQPGLPERGYRLVRIRHRDSRDIAARSLGESDPILWWADRATKAARSVDINLHLVSGCCDPFHLLDGASELIVDADDELALLGAICGVPVRTVGEGAFADSATPTPRKLRRLVASAVGAFDYRDPFTGDSIDALSAISLCGFWRRLIDGNRGLSGVIGVAFWKRDTLGPLLWPGSSRLPYLSGASRLGRGDAVAVWKARTPPAVLSELERRNVRIVEIEDGFIRSAGLGADCVPPLSVVIDRVGVHFDPREPSELEEMLESGQFSEDVLRRARQLREVIVGSGLSKYESGGARRSPSSSDRRRILVPGQVEDDRAVICGGQGLASNLELLRRVRADAPDAHIVYKPHPDVEAGHRRGEIADETCLGIADEITRGTSISVLLESVDEVHVNSSLAGFEALLRGKPVTTHGVPFYAGWGLTRDLGRVPARRTGRRSLDELVAAVLLLYPRYLDPVTGLPCPPEVLVRRLSESPARPADGLLVRLRRIQGRWNRRLARLRSKAAR